MPTRKFFQQLAGTLGNTAGLVMTIPDFDHMVAHVAKVLAGTNPNFDMCKFVAACRKAREAAIRKE